MTTAATQLAQLNAKLQRLAAAARADGFPVVAVGYTARQALKLHEDTQMKWAGRPRRSGIGVYWGPNGQAKFLESPARELRSVLSFIVAQAMRAGKTMAQGLLLAGLRLQRESQLRVPVEHGELRRSAFTRLES